MESAAHDDTPVSAVRTLSASQAALIRLQQRRQTRYTAGEHTVELACETRDTGLRLTAVRDRKTSDIYCTAADLAQLLEEDLYGADIALLPDAVLIALCNARLSRYFPEFQITGLDKDARASAGIAVIFTGAIFIFSDISLIYSRLELIPPLIAAITVPVRICSPSFVLPRREILTLQPDDLLVSPLADTNSSVAVYYHHQRIAAGSRQLSEVQIRKMTTITSPRNGLSGLNSTVRFELAETDITLAELAALKPDALIPLTNDSPHYIRVICDNRHIADGILVTFQSRLAVQIKSLTTAVTENTGE